MIGRRWATVALAGVLVVGSASACSEPDPPPAPPADTVAHGIVVTPTGVVAPILSAFEGGYWVRTPCFGVGLVLGDAEAITRIDAATIVLDPGHGGPEQGAVGPNGLEEKEVNLDVARQVADQLRGAGIDTVLTRTDDGYIMTLRTRAEIATALAPEALVSVHHNSSDQPPSDIPGSETYFQIGSSDGERLARLLYQDVVAGFEPFDVAWVRPGDAGAKYRQGDDGDYYGILRYSKPVVAVISEGAFMSNPAEADFLRTPEARRAEADSITAAIRRYLAEPRETTVSTTSVPAADAPVPGTNATYAPAEDADGCVDPPLF